MFKGAAGEGVHREFISCIRQAVADGGLLKFGKDAVAHLSGGSVGESDGDDLAGLVDLGEQAEEAAGQQVGFARAGRGLDQDGTAGIEGAIALGLIGRHGFLSEATHRRPPRCQSLPQIRVGAGFRSPGCGREFAGRNARRFWGIRGD